jgi:hypothetical protein
MSCGNSSSKCNPCGPSEDAMNAIANRANYYARVAQNAADQVNNFETIYLGAKTTAPTTDNEGNPLIQGALYFNTTDDTMYVWDGAAWVTVAVFNENTDYQVTGTPTARNLVTRGADIINVKDFGAVGDGVAEDGPAFRAAFALANTKLTSCVYVPQGTYKINTFSEGQQGLPWNQSDRAYNRSSILVESPVIERSISFIGEGATITSDIWPDYPKDTGFNGGYTPAPIWALITFAGNYNILVDGISFVNPFGGVGQKPIIPSYSSLTSGQANNLIVPYGRTIAISTNKFADFPNNTYNGKGSLVITNCKFRDFGCAINPNSSHSFITIDNNYIVQTYGKMSAHNGGFPGGMIHYSNGPVCDKITITNNYFSGYDLPIVKNPDGTIKTPDMTFLQAYSQTKTTVQGVPYLFNFIELPENAIHIDGALNTASIIIANNQIKGFWIEGIKFDRYTDATQIFEGKIVIEGNSFDGTTPLGSQVFAGGSAIVVNGQSVVVSNNHIKNYPSGITINQQALQQDLKNINITDNTIEFKGYATTGYQGSPIVQDPLQAISVDAAKNIIIDSNLVYFDNVGVPTPNNPTIASGCNMTFLRGIGSSDAEETYSNNLVTVSNNIGYIKNKRNPSLKYVGFFDICFGSTYRNNRIEGWDIFSAQKGGREFAFPVIDDGNIFNGSIYQENISGQGLSVNSKTQDHKLYPTSTGWYQLVAFGPSANGTVEFNICVHDANGTGESFFNTQRTKLLVNYNSNPYGTSNSVFINQLSHLDDPNVGPVITKFAATTNGVLTGAQCAMFAWVYVNKILKTCPVIITGGGGSNAAATANFTNGVCTSVTVNTAGSGYTSAPTLKITRKVSVYGGIDLVGSGAVLVPTMSGGGLQSVAVSNGGSGYAVGIHINAEQKNYLDYGPSGDQGVFVVRKIEKSDGTNNLPLPTTSNSLIFDFSHGEKSIYMTNPSGINSGASRFKLGSATIKQASGVPSSTPEFIGQDYLDTATNKFYKAKGTASSADWVALN